MANAIEYVGAALAVLYLLLAIKQWRSCWIAAFASSVLYVLVMFRARLYMESVLNGFYAAMALYGYWCWRESAAEGRGAKVHRWPLRRHALGLLGVLLLAALSSWLLRRYTAAASPRIDSLIAWASVFATFLVARKVFENWHWWLLIDALAMFVYYTRGLYLTALLFALYLAMIFFGMRAWRRDLEPAHA
jgi:nicotinamide mononucleotide transporter